MNGAKTVMLAVPSAPALGVLQAVTFARGFQDVATVREPIERRPGKPLAAQDLGPVLAVSRNVDRKIAIEIAKLFSHTEPSIRAAAIRAIGAKPYITNAKHLFKYLNDTAVSVKLAAISAMPKIGDPACVERLLQVLSDDDLNVRKEAIQAVLRFDDKIIGAAFSGKLKVCDAATVLEVTDVLKTITNASSDLVLSLLSIVLERPEPELRASAISTIVHFDDREGSKSVLTQVIRHVNDPQPSVRQAVVRALAQAPSVRHLAELGKLGMLTERLGTGLFALFNRALEDSDECVRLAGVEAIGDLKLPGAIPLLLQFAFRRGASYSERSRVQAAVKKYESSEAAAGALIAISDPDFAVQREAVAILKSSLTRISPLSIAMGGHTDAAAVISGIAALKDMASKGQSEPACEAREALAQVERHLDDSAYFPLLWRTLNEAAEKLRST